MTTFDFNKYVGSDGYWFEIYSHDVPIATTDCDCVRYHQTPLTSTTYNDQFNCRKRSADNKDITIFNSTLYLNTNASESGKMSEAVLSDEKSQYWVLDVIMNDENDKEYSYALVYACVDLILEKDEFVYFFSKNASMPDDIYQNWYQYLKQKDVYLSDVRQIPQDGCW